MYALSVEPGDHVLKIAFLIKSSVGHEQGQIFSLTTLHLPEILGDRGTVTGPFRESQTDQAIGLQIGYGGTDRDGPAGHK